MFYLAISADFSAEPLHMPDLRKRSARVRCCANPRRAHRCLLRGVLRKTAPCAPPPYPSVLIRTYPYSPPPGPGCFGR